MNIEKDYKILSVNKKQNPKSFEVEPKPHYRKKPICPECNSSDHCVRHNNTTETLTHVDSNGNLIKITVHKARFKCKKHNILLTEELNEKKTYTQEFREYLVECKKKGWSRERILKHFEISSATERKIISEYYKEKRRELKYELPYFLGIGLIQYGKITACVLFDIWESKVIDIVDLKDLHELSGREKVGEIYLVNSYYVDEVEEAFSEAWIGISPSYIIERVEDALINDAKKLNFGKTRLNFNKLLREEDEKEIGKAVRANSAIVPILTTLKIAKKEKGDFRSFYRYEGDFKHFEEFRSTHNSKLYLQYKKLPQEEPLLKKRILKEFLKRSRDYLNKMEKDKRVNLDFYTQIGFYLYSDITERAVIDKNTDEVMINHGTKF